jgi:hypothetical protein
MFETIKQHAGAITSIVAMVAAIGGGVLYVNDTYAQSKDVKTMLELQEQQLKEIVELRRSQQMFQLEYYDDRIKSINEQLVVVPNANPNHRLLQRELQNIELRRELTRRALVAP